jgi:hypothetical protein
MLKSNKIWIKNSKINLNSNLSIITQIWINFIIKIKISKYYTKFNHNNSQYRILETTPIPE